MGPRGLVIFIPPAVDGEAELQAEAQALEAIGFATLLYRPPYRKEDPAYVFGDPVKEKDRWNKARNEFHEILDAAHARGFTKSQIAVVGKNLGGSLGSFVSAQKVGCFIAAGSIPRLSAFYSRSSHPIAVERRKNLSEASLERFTSAIRTFDLAETLSKKEEVNVLIQFGSADPWIDTFQVKAFEASMHESHKLRWIEDEHSMNSKAAVEQRRNWIIESLG
ncbi:MAG: hypothetical protein V4692_05745 [Bdellovibrionota bacterium]